MSNQLDPEEVQAIADAMTDDTGATNTPLDVTERDFAVPKRLSLEVIKKLDATLRISIPRLKRSLQAVLPAEFQLEPTSVREMTALGLFEGIRQPFVIARFESQGAPGWVSWTQEPALDCVQAALGMAHIDADGDDEDDNAPESDREFSYIERKVLGRLIEAIISPLAQVFKFEVDDMMVAEKQDDIGSWEDAGADADDHRLCVDLELIAFGRTSTLTLYLPGFHSKDVEEEEEQLASTPPHHLENIPVEMRALFDSVEVPLKQLLDLEVGDILPLSPIRSTHLTVNVGHEPVARGQLGRNFERLAVRVLEVFDPPKREI
ncbi:MAG: flagellar motor switch protein FliM [Planctomycetota bacterium]|jgi:flagellar motor switch protein FliM